jgi:hypothetical protein
MAFDEVLSVAGGDEAEPLRSRTNGFGVCEEQGKDADREAEAVDQAPKDGSFAFDVSRETHGFP